MSTASRENFIKKHPLIEHCSGFGSAYYNTHRHLIFGALVIISLIGFVFTLAGLFPAASDSRSVVQNVPWTTVEVDSESGRDYNFYFGLFHMVEKRTTVTGDVTYKDISFDSDDCTDSWCQECDDAGVTAMATLAVSFALQLGTIFQLYSRGFGNDDALHKFWGIILEIVIFSLLAIGLGNYSKNCHDAIPVNFVDGVDGSYQQYGAGFGLMVCVMLFRFPIFLFHYLTPVKVGAHGKYGVKAATSEDIELDAIAVDPNNNYEPPPAESEKTVTIHMDE